jgi:hypothetical protein
VAGSARYLRVHPTNAWAVGYTDDSVDHFLHWNGKTWRVVRAGKSLDQNLGPVSTSSPANVWAIADVAETHHGPVYGLIHWNGRRWSRHNPTAAETLVSVATDGPHRVWAVGTRNIGQPVSRTGPFALRLDGSRWVMVREPRFCAEVSFTQVAMNGSSVWAVGYNVHQTKEYLLHSYGNAWRVVPTRQWGNVRQRIPTGISAGPKTTALALGRSTTGTPCVAGSSGETGHTHGLILVAHGRSTHRIDPTVTGTFHNPCFPPPPP